MHHNIEISHLCILLVSLFQWPYPKARPFPTVVSDVSGLSHIKSIHHINGTQFNKHLLVSFNASSISIQQWRWVTQNTEYKWSAQYGPMDGVCSIIHQMMLHDSKGKLFIRDPRSWNSVRSHEKLRHFFFQYHQMTFYYIA